MERVGTTPFGIDRINPEEVFAIPQLYALSRVPYC